jgi:hypothetical protein
MSRILTGVTPFDARLLTLGDCYCEDEAKTMVQKMLNLVEIVGEGYECTINRSIQLSLAFYLDKFIDMSLCPLWFQHPRRSSSKRRVSMDLRRYLPCVESDKPC